MADPLHDWATFMAATATAESTIKLRLSTLRHLLRHSGLSDPAAITRRDVLTFLSRPIKPWTKTTYWRCICAWDEWAREFGYSTESITRSVPKPRTPPPVARPLDDEAVERLLAAPLSGRARAYVLLALFEALRVHEIARIRGEDFDFVAGWLMVNGKGGVTKPIPIHPTISQMGAVFPTHGYWFPSLTNLGRPVAAQAVSATIRAAMLSAGVDATAHQLRDTAATRIQREVRDIRLTQAFLRHSSVATTQKYCAVSNTALQEAAAMLRWPAA